MAQVTPPLAHDEHDKEQGMHTEISANDGRGGPIVDELSLTTKDGPALTGSTDVALAELRRTYYEARA